MCNLAALLVLTALTGVPTKADYFTISVVDDETGRPVPLVELRTVSNLLYITDSQGLIAFQEPGLMNQKVFFFVKSHGYEYRADGFGFRGKALQTEPNSSTELRIRRINFAHRLYRVTGEGIYQDTVLLGGEAPIAHPLLNAQVLGSDSVQTTVFRQSVHWFWGDTNRPAYPLGAFHVPGAVSQLPAAGGLDPARGVNLEYFKREDGFAANLAEMPGEGPTWIDGLCVIGGNGQPERMFAKYVKVRKLLDVYERGLVEFNAGSNRFEHRVTFDFSAPLYPHGYAFPRTVDGRDYLYFGNPYPHTRVAASAEALADSRQYEAFTCLATGSRLEKPKIDRDRRGIVHYAWKRDTPAIQPQDEAKLIKDGLLKQSERLLPLRDIQTGKPVAAHAGSVAWNDFRRRFVMITGQSGGTSFLGEIWYAEADTPVGPWVYARKIVTHDKYSFYNPRQHAMFDQLQGKRIFFEGTYTHSFSGNDNPTPRYDYNQIMYSLDLDTPALALPVPVYETVNAGHQTLATGGPPAADKRIAFMALDRPGHDSVAVTQQSNGKGGREFVVSPAGKSPAAPAASQSKTENDATEVRFHAPPADRQPVAPDTIALFEWQHADGERFYAVEGETAPKGFVRKEKPLCRVWRPQVAKSITFE